MKYAIASYQRAECKTAVLLKSLGVPNSDIIISTQTLEDYNEYKTKHECEILYAPKDCAAGNRNTLLENINEPLLLLDDDIRSFQMFTDGKWRKNNELALAALNDCFALAKKNGCACFGVSPNDNDLVTRNRYPHDINVLLQGTVIGVLDNSIRFNERWKMVEDYELSIRLLRSGKRLLRANYLCAGKPKNGTNEGGLHGRYAKGELPFWIAKLHEVYPEFKPNKNMDEGKVKSWTK